MKKNSTSNLCFLFSYALVSLSLTSATFANNLPNGSVSNDWENASVEALTDAISQTSIQIKEHAQKASKIKETIQFAWNNPNFTSDSIIAKRQALKEAEAAFIQARIDLQEEMYRLPEIQQLSEDNKTLLNKVESLRSDNTKLIRLLKIRRKTVPSNE